jgi:outer membrane receptor protein involved in Fe transport
MTKTRLLKLLGLLVLWVATTGLNLMAQNVTVKGVVKDVNDGKPMPGLTVSVPAAGVGDITKEDGSYSLSVPKSPEIKVRFALDDFDSTVVVNTADGAATYTLDLLGGVKSFFQKDVVISDGRHEKPIEKVTGSLDLIKPIQIDRQASQSITDALQQKSSVDIIDGQPNIRGSSGYAYGVGSRVMVMLDGLPLLSPDASFAQFDLIPTDNIKQVEVLKGASSVLYGSSALGGVINVIMADAPTKPKTSIRLRSTAYDAPYNKALDWDGAGKFAKSAGINVFHTQKIGNQDLTGLIDLWHDTGFRYGTGATKGRAQIMTKFRPGVKGLSFGVNASMAFDSSTTFLFWDSYLPADTLLHFTPGDTTFGSKGALAGTGSARSQLNTRYTVDPFIRYLTPKGFVHQYRGRVMLTYNTNNTNQSSNSSMFYNDYQFTRTLFDTRVTWVSGATAMFNRINGGALYGGLHHSMNLAVYSQLDANISPKLVGSVGARFDNWTIDDTINNRSPIFRVGTNYEIRKGTNVRASFGQAFRSPSIAERYTNTFASGLTIAPNPDLKVEKGYSVELAIHQGFKNPHPTNTHSVLGYLDVAAFMMNYNNMIEFGVKQPDTFNFIDLKTVFWAKNYAHARTSGIEATGMIQVTENKFTFDFNGGVTYILPVNLNPVDTSRQADLLNTIGPQSNPFNFNAYGMLATMFSPQDCTFHREDNPKVLKYRSTWLNRFSATVGYGKFNLTVNYRYKSQIKAIDQFLYVAIPGSADFVLSHPKGYSLYDFIVGWQAMDNFNVSLIAKNAFNKEYVILPGIIGEQRSLNLQLKYVIDGSQRKKKELKEVPME